MVRLAAAFAASVAPAAADVIHLKNGSTIKTDLCWEQDGEVRYRRAGGVVGIPKEMVDRIEKSADAASGPASGPRGTRPSRVRRGAGAAAAAEPPPVSIQLPPPGGMEALPEDPNGWTALLRDLEARAGRPGADEAGLRRRIAVLHTLLGNEAARSGDLDGAESSYRLAADNDPGLMAPVLNLSRVRIAQGRNDDAERILDAALATWPEDPTALALRAEVAYRTDRLDEAVELWERSIALRPSEDLSSRLAKARRELQAEEGYYRSDAPHFTLKYDGEKASEALSREILDHLETAYGDLTSRFNVYPASVIIVTLYPRESFHDVTESPRWVGGLFDGQIRIPVGGLTRLTAAARGVFTHELSHAVVWHKTRGNCPRWLQEGIAQWVEGKSARPHARELVQRYAETQPADLEAAFSYPMALSLLERFLETWSFSHLLDVLEILGRGGDLDAAFLSATGGTAGDFYASWLAALKDEEARP